MISSHVKITCYFHMWKCHRCDGCIINSRLSQEKTVSVEMVWYFIGVYIINRTLHGRWETRIFSSTLEEKFRIFARPCNILYVLVFKRSNDWKKYRITFFKVWHAKKNLAWNWCYIIALYIHLSAMLRIFWTVGVFSGIKNE